MCPCYLFHIGAGCTVRFSHIKKRANISNRTAKFACAADEFEKSGVTVAVHAPATYAARWRRKQSNRLIISDRLDSHACLNLKHASRKGIASRNRDLAHL